MASVSEAQLANWTNPASNSEDSKRDNTERMIRDAIRAHPYLTTISGNISVYAKGSYKNNTNVRRDSDVDIAVEYTGVIFPEYVSELDHAEVDRVQGLTPYSGPFQAASGGFDKTQFKDAIGEAMVQAFGGASVTRSNKVFTVRESSRSLAADVVPCATNRWFTSTRSYQDGIRLLPDRSPGYRIDNYPQQHYDNGVAKNIATSKRFKSVVRILKNLENKMVEDGASPVVQSYLIESLAYNSPDTDFLAGTWAQRVRNVLAHIWNDTMEDGAEKRWFEVNGIKYLFHVHQKWTLAEARAFADAAWQYVENS